MNMLSPRGKAASEGQVIDKKEADAKKGDRKKKLLLLGSSVSEIPQVAKVTNSPSPIRRTKVHKQKYPTLNCPVSLSFDDATTATATDSPRGSCDNEHSHEKDKDKENNNSSGNSSAEDTNAAVPSGGRDEGPLGGLIGRLRSFSIDRSGMGDITPRMKSPKKKESPKKKDSKDIDTHQQQQQQLQQQQQREVKTQRKDNFEARTPSALSSSSSRNLGVKGESVSGDYHATFGRNSRRRKQLSQILEGLDVAGMSQWDETDEAWDRGTRTLTAFRKRNKISNQTLRGSNADSSGSGSDGESDKKAAKKQRKKEEREKRKKEKAEERGKKATLRLMRKRGHTRSGSEISNRSNIRKKPEWKASLPEDGALGSPVDLGTRAKSGMAMADLSPRGAQHRKTGDEWWREELKKRGGGNASIPAQDSRPGEGGVEGGEPAVEGAVAENLLTSEERQLRAKEVEEYNKKLQEDQKNRRHRVLDLLTEWEHQIVVGDEVVPPAEATPGAVTSAPATEEPKGQAVATTEVAATDASSIREGEGEGEGECPVAPPAPVTPEPPLAVASSSNDALQTTATVVTLRTLTQDKPTLEESAEPAATSSSSTTDEVIATPAVEDLATVAPARVSTEIGSAQMGGGQRQPNEDEDVVEIEITRQDPVPTADGKGTHLVETKKMTIQVIVKRRDKVSSSKQPQPLPSITVQTAEVDGQEGEPSDVDEAEEDQDDELFFSQENEAVLVPFGRCGSMGDGEEASGNDDEEEEDTSLSPEEQLRNVERELQEKMKAMAALRREVKRLKARRQGFIRAARRNSERRSSECI